MKLIEDKSSDNFIDCDCFCFLWAALIIALNIIKSICSKNLSKSPKKRQLNESIVSQYDFIWLSGKKYTYLFSVFTMEKFDR